MAMKSNYKECVSAIENSLNDEFHFLAGCSPIWILSLLSNKKYILVPRQRIVVSPNTEIELIEWVKSDAFSSNCASLERYMNGDASKKEMLQYAKEMIRNIEYQTDKENLEETLRSARWVLNKTELIIKEL